MRATEASSTSRGPARAMMRASAARRRSSTTIIASTISRSGSRASSIPMDQICTERRTGDLEFHRTSPEECADHDLWRRLANKIFLFCRRSYRGFGAPHEFLGRLGGTSQSGQPGGDHHQGGRRRDHIPNRFTLSSGYLSLPADDPRQRCPDISRARERLTGNRESRSRSGWNARSRILKTCSQERLKRSEN